jgi:hypothetical protein
MDFVRDIAAYLRTASPMQTLGVALARAVEDAAEGRWLEGDTVGFSRTESGNEVDLSPLPLPDGAQMSVPIESKWALRL